MNNFVIIELLDSNDLLFYQIAQKAQLQLLSLDILMYREYKHLSSLPKIEN